MGSLKTNKIDFNDYQPRRLGLKMHEKMIVLEYTIPSKNKRFHHYIRLSKYQPLLDISQSMSVEQVREIVDSVMIEHAKYFQDKITSQHIGMLVNRVAKRDVAVLSPNKKQLNKSKSNSPSPNQRKNNNSNQDNKDASQINNNTLKPQNNSTNVSSNNANKNNSIKLPEPKNKFGKIGGNKNINAKKQSDNNYELESSQNDDEVVTSNSQTSYYQKFQQNKQSPPKKQDKAKQNPPALNFNKAQSEQIPSLFNKNSAFDPLTQFSMASQQQQQSEEPKKLLPWERNNKAATSTTITIDQPQNQQVQKQSNLEPLAPIKQQPLTSLSNLPPPLINKAKSYQPSAWDDDGGWGGNDDEDWNFEDIEKPKPSNNTKTTNKFDSKDSDSDNENEIDYNTYNLNKLSNSELQKHKKKMDKKFDKNFVPPTDPNFVYDKRKEFKPSTTKISGGGDDSWDEDNDF
eukprot:403335509